jgi:hypothetical protein
MNLADETLIEVEIPEYNSIDSMCNVTFLKNKYSTILTSDWDGNVERGYSLPPMVTSRNNKNLIFTRDEKTGGSWFAANEDGDIAVLMNRESHDLAREHHRKSCSLVLLDIISSDAPIEAFAEMELQYTQAFSLIIYTKQRLFELVWENGEKEINVRGTLAEHMWSSVPAADGRTADEREKLFKDFLIAKPKPYATAIRTFHKELCKAHSITQAVLINNTIMLYHTDVLENKFYITSLPLKNALFHIRD